MKNYKNIFLILIAGIILSTGCTKNKTENKADNTEVNNNSTAVYVESVKKQTIKPQINGTGSLKAYETAVVSSENSGNLSNVYFREGQSVSVGTTLASVNSTDYVLMVRNAQAGLSQAKASYENTRTEYNRKKTLYQKEIIPRQQFDDVETRLTLSSSDIDRAQSNLALARQELRKATISSPISGFIKTKLASTGDYVKAGTPIFEIIKINPLKLIFTVPEESISKIKKGQEVNFTVNAFPDKQFKAVVRTLYPDLDEQTRNLSVEAVVNNSNGLLKPGMFADINIFTGESKSILTVPSVAVMFDDENASVYVIQNGAAKIIPVKVGNKYGEMTEIVEGLTENQQVIVSGQQGLVEGVKVHVAR